MSIHRSAEQLSVLIGNTKKLRSLKLKPG